MKVSISLKKSNAKPGAAPSLKQPAAFASLEDDEPIDAAPTASGSQTTGVNRKLAAQAPKMSKAQQKRAEEAKQVDETVYEYDEVWDKMQAAKERQKEKKNAETQERKVSTNTSKNTNSWNLNICLYFIAEIYSFTVTDCYSPQTRSLKGRREDDTARTRS